MYPRLQFDLPILSMDLVASAETGAVSLAIADPCPVTPDLSLPSFYAEPIRRGAGRPGRGARGAGAGGRGRAGAVRAGGRGARSCGGTLHTRGAAGAVRSGEQPTGARLGPQHLLPPLHHHAPPGHARYAEQMLLNDKTRRVLEKSFSPGLADAYLRHVMFDVEDLPPAG
eukprot:scaffold12.g8056.t1